jgi:predicted DNA-binding protein (UPF0251 family)
MTETASITALWDEFQHLSAHQRRVVFLMYWDGHTEAETAETMGIHRNTVSRALLSATSRLEKKLTPVVQRNPHKTLVVVGKENGTDKRGNGLVPDNARKAKAPPGLESPAVSQCPKPDTYYGSPERVPFLEALEDVCASAFLQVMDRGTYNERARRNREMISSADPVSARWDAKYLRGTAKIL